MISFFLGAQNFNREWSKNSEKFHDMRVYGTWIIVDGLGNDRTAFATDHEAADVDIPYMEGKGLYGNQFHRQVFKQ